MSDEYYYLLDGKEHGPFSRAAIESLMASGKLVGFFVRQGSDQPWRAPDELGLGTASPSPHMPTSASDPAAVVFRSQREIKGKSSAGPLIIGLFVFGVVSAVVWVIVKPKGSHVAQISSSKNQQPSAGSGAVAATSRVKLSDLQTGNWCINKCQFQIDDGRWLVRNDSRTPGVRTVLQLESGGMFEGSARSPLRQGEIDGDECLLTKFRTLILQSRRTEVMDTTAGVCAASRERSSFVMNESLPPIETGSLYVALLSGEGISAVLPVAGIKRVAPPKVIDVLEDKPHRYEELPPKMEPEGTSEVTNVAANTTPTRPDSSPEPAAESVAAEEFSNEPLSAPSPRYPPGPERLGIEGRVELVLTVSPNGNVTDARIESSSRNRDLDKAAMSTAMAWRFKRSKTGGQVRTPIEFKLLHDGANLD